MFCALCDPIYLLTHIPTPNIGNVYIADWYNNRIRKVTVSTGIISTVAGNGGYAYSGDNGPATSAELRGPVGVAADVSGRITIIVAVCCTVTQYVVHLLIHFLIINELIFPHPIGNVYMTDFYNNRIRKVTLVTGIITTIAGTGEQSYSGDNGAATSAALNLPYGVTLDASGTVITAITICCTVCHRIFCALSDPFLLIIINYYSSPNRQRVHR